MRQKTVSDAKRPSRKGRPRSLPRPENPDGELGASEEARLQVLRLLQRIERLALKLDVAFGGQPFLPGLSPTCPANRRRFEAFLDEQQKVSRLFHQVIELYLITCRVKEEYRWIPLLIEELSLRVQRQHDGVKPQRGPVY